MLSNLIITYMIYDLGQWYSRVCGLPPVLPHHMALSCYQTIHKLNVLTFGGGKLLGRYTVYLIVLLPYHVINMICLFYLSTVSVMFLQVLCRKFFYSFLISLSYNQSYAAGILSSSLLHDEIFSLHFFNHPSSVLLSVICVV